MEGGGEGLDPLSAGVVHMTLLDLKDGIRDIEVGDKVFEDSLFDHRTCAT